MLSRRQFLNTALPAAWMLRAADLYAQATTGLPPLTITNVKVIGTSPRRGYSWVFVKVETSEPGLYGIGSANDAYLCWAVKAALEKHYAPFWKGQDADRIEDLWQWNYQRSYWRNGPVPTRSTSSSPTTSTCRSRASASRKRMTSLSRCAR